MNIEQRDTRAKQEIRAAIGFARERRWCIINKRCVSVRTVRGKDVTCVCPIAALILMNATERARNTALKKGSMTPDYAARRAATILGVKPYAMHQFMGSFDNNPDDETKPPKMTPSDERFSDSMIDFAHLLRKELRPKAA